MRAILAIACAACGAQPGHAGETIDWSRPPPVPAPAAYAPPAPADVALPGGVRLVLAPNDRLPIVAVAIVNLAAGSREDRARHGVAALTAELVVEGFAADLERLGARLDVAIATDAATLELQVQPAHLRAALALVAEALERPRFRDADVLRVRAAHADRVAQHRAMARTAAAQRFDALVFGDHPYAHPADGDPEIVAALAPADVREFHDIHYGPSGTTVIAAGAIDHDGEAALRSFLGGWHGLGVPSRTAPLPPAAPPRIEIVDRPGATTAVIVAGGRGQAGGARDRVAAELANTALGGGASSRLDRRFHDELDLSLAASSSFWRGAAGGSWAIATTVQRADAKRAIVELRAQLAAARAAPFSAAELETARVQLRRALPHLFETDLGTVRAFARLVVQGEPLDYYARFRDRLDRVTPETARAAVAPLWTDPMIVVVGDAALLRPALEGL